MNLPSKTKLKSKRERERDQRNVKRNVDWENECKAIEFKGPLVDGIPWDEADTKVKSLIYLCIGTEGQRIYHQRFPHSNVNTISAFELFHELSLSFTRPRNTTYDRFLLFTCKQKENEKLEIFHCRLKALGAQCRLGTAEDDLIKDLFIDFMNNTEIQSELLTETRTPAQVLQYALNKERGQENQRAIAGRLRATNILDNQIAHIGSNQYSQQRRPQPQNSRSTTQQQRRPQQQRNQGQSNPCRRCGAPFSLEHLQICPAKKAQCNNCKRVGHFAKVCRSTRPTWNTNQQQLGLNNPPARRIRNIRQQESTSSTSGEHNTTIEQETLDPDSTYYIQEIIDSWNQVNHVKSCTFTNRNPPGIDASLNNEIWIKTRSNNINIEWIADTGSPKSFINEATANSILQKCNKATRLSYNQDPEKYRCFNNVSIPITGILQLDLTSGYWTSRYNKILIVKTQTVTLLGRDVLSKLGFSLSQKQGKQINHISTELSFKKKIVEQFPHLCTRIGKSKNHIAKSDIKNNITPTQHKGRRVPVHLTDKVDKEIKHLLDTNQIIKLDKCSDDVFISPIVITVKHDKSIKFALDSQLLNDAINKNKYQMQSIDNLMDAVAKYLSDSKQTPGEFFFSKIDLKYAYSQLPLHPTIQKHCNFNILGGKSTGTYRFINGFYGLSDMPATFQKQSIKPSKTYQINSTFLTISY